MYVTEKYVIVIIFYLTIQAKSGSIKMATGFCGGNCMYKIGDKVAFPMHGAGIIDAIEEQEILGVVKKYYVMRSPFGDMKIMIPMDSVSEVGVRDVIGKEEAEELIKSFECMEVEENANWNKRYRENMVKIKSGDILEVASVVKALMFRDLQRGLSTGERKMLTSAKQIIISEIVLATGLKNSDIEQKLKDIVVSQAEVG